MQLQHRCHKRHFCCKLMRLHTGPFCQSPRLLSSLAAAHSQTRPPSVSRAGHGGTLSPVLRGYGVLTLFKPNPNLEKQDSPLDPPKWVLGSNKCVSLWCAGGSYRSSTQASALAACTAVTVKSNGFYKLSHQLPQSTLRPQWPEKPNWVNKLVFYMQTDVLKYSISALLDFWQNLCENATEKLHFVPGPDSHTEWALQTRARCGESFLQFSLGATSIITLWTLMAPFSSLCSIHLDVVTLVPKSAHPPHVIKVLSSLNIKNTPPEGGDEGISSRAEEPGYYEKRFRHLGPAWCCSWRSFPASSTKDPRVQPMVLLACGMELGGRTTIKETPVATE